jgi:serine/threonine protein kinase
MENLLISDDFDIIFCDFGFAQPSDAPVQKIFGSEGYTAPEIFTGEAIDLKKCDIFSLGVIYFILVTGSIPF